MEQEFVGQVALVTGAAGAGIGRAIADRLASGGATLVLTDAHAGRTREVAAELSARYGTDVLGRPLDVADRSAADRVLSEVQAMLGPVRILVNNAAQNVMASMIDLEPADWDRVLAVNLSGPWYLSRGVMRQMRDAGVSGSIVNVSTTAPDSGGLGLECAYAASKGGLNVLTRSCAHEGGPWGIRANTVTMGVVRGTRFTDVLHPDIADEAERHAPLRRLPHATDIAEAVAFLVSDRAATITGETLNVAAGHPMRY